MNHSSLVTSWGEKDVNDKFDSFWHSCIIPHCGTVVILLLICVSKVHTGPQINRGIINNYLPIEEKKKYTQFSRTNDVNFNGHHFMSDREQKNTDIISVQQIQQFCLPQNTTDHCITSSFILLYLIILYMKKHWKLNFTYLWSLVKDK